MAVSSKGWSKGGLKVFVNAIIIKRNLGEGMARPKAPNASFKIANYSELSKEQKIEVKNLKISFFEHTVLPEIGVDYGQATRELKSQEHLIFLRAGKPVGFLMWREKADKIIIDQIYSRSSRKGIATALLTRVIKIARPKRKEILMDGLTGEGRRFFESYKRRYENRKAGKGTPAKRKSVLSLQKPFFP